MILIIDYDIGNVGSVKNMLAKAGHDAEIGRSPEAFARAERMILPGVGSFDAGMERLHSLELVRLIREHAVVKKKPLLGICLGFQLLMGRSDEGVREGLSLLPGAVRRIVPSDTALRVPHMGWADVDVPRPHWLFAGLAPAPRFYFVHSYEVVCERPVDIIATTQYGSALCAAAGREQLVGVQFHPEKSHSFGMTLLDNFARHR